MKILFRCSAIALLASILLVGCLASSTTPSPAGPTQSLSPGASPESTPTPSSTGEPSVGSLEGEFVAINVYRTTSIDYYPGLRTGDGAYIVLDSSDSVPYERLMSTDSGMLSEIRFHLAGQSLSVACSVKEYAMGVELVEVYLPDAKTTVYMGRSGVRIRVSGKSISVKISGLQGLPVYSVTQCERLG
jgi:hypothetical protein